MMGTEADKSPVQAPSPGKGLTTVSALGAASASGGRSKMLRSLRSLPSILLAAVCVWAVVQLFVLRTEESDEPEPGAADPPHREAVQVPAETTVKSPPRLIDGERLLSVRVLRENLNVEPLAKNVLRAGEATLLNFWGTFCVPCIEELPAFKEVTDDLEAPMLHFVPVLVDDQVKSSEARAMYDTLGGPSPQEFVSDARLPDADRRGLTELEAALGGRVRLPTTVVLDCRQHIHWWKTGKLEARDFKKLRSVLDQVIAELDTPLCVAERRRARRLQHGDGQEERPLATPKPRSACNADGVCDGERGETVKTCPVDCKPTILTPRI